MERLISMVIKALKKVFLYIFSTVDERVHRYIRLLCWAKQKNHKVFGLMVSRMLQRKYGVFLPYTAKFDASLILRHPIGIVIGERVSVGSNVTIFQNVTLGRSNTYLDAYPSIGDGTIIYSGAVILGGINVGANCIIGANAVVIKDVPDNSIAVGIPARIISRDNSGEM